MHPSERGDKLLAAIIEDNDDEALKLLKQDVDLNRTMKGDNAIHLVARRGNMTMMKKLKEKGADLGQTNENGNTPMHYAAKEGYIDLVKYLLQCQADLNARNNDGETPLHMAVTSLSMDLVEDLISLGMEVNSTSPMTGETPLHQALKYGRQEAMEALLIKGAKVKVRDKNGRRPEDVGKTREIRESLRMYGSLLIAMEAGYIQARGLKLSRDLVEKPFTVDRTDMVVERIDIPKEIIPSFYCRREKVENSSIVIERFEDEQVFSDIFHIRITDSNRDCSSRIYLPLYSPPGDKEELVLRFMSNEYATDEPIKIDEPITQDKHVYCPLETKLIPETTCVSVVYVRPKQEHNKVTEDGSLIKSKLEKDFQLDVPAGAFGLAATLSLKVFDTEDEVVSTTDEKKADDEMGTSKSQKSVNEKHGTSSLLTSVFQINVSDGVQPTKGVLVQLPLSKDMKNADDIAIVHADETQIGTKNGAVEVVQTKPKIVGCNIVFEVSQFCIYVAAPKQTVASPEELEKIQEQISNARDRRKPGVFFAVVKQLEGLKHLVMLECVTYTKSRDRRKHWNNKGFEVQTPNESEAIMMKSGDTFTIELKGNASLEEEHEARERRVQFSQCRSSFQPYTVLLDKSVSLASMAVVDLVINKHMEDGTRREVARLPLQLHVPPPETVKVKQDGRYLKPPDPRKSHFQALKSFFRS